MTVYNIPVSKIDIVLSFDTATLPPNSVEFVTEFGLRQYLADGHAAIKRSDYADGDAGTAAWQADVRAGVMARDEKLRSGNFARRSADPVKTLAAQMGMTEDELKVILAQAAEKKAEKKRRAA